MRTFRARLAGLILGLALFSVAQARADAQTMTVLLTNGPSSNRLNIAFLSEGYTSAQLGQFLIDATNALNTLLATAPYQEYRNYVNAYAIAVASAQSGSDHPPSTFVNTYFNSTYDTSLTLITIPSDGTGQGKIDSLLQTYVPRCHLPVLLVNDSIPAGSDGFDKTAIAATSAISTYLVHETGHVLANLGDEYTAAYPGFPDTEEPNTTRSTNYSAIKWKSWIATNTPLPTPPTAPYVNTVGLFEGAHYHTTGWYRPKLNCAMRNQGSPFCEVCAEALVLAIYAKAKPVDAFLPATNYLSITNNQSVSLSVSLLQPLTHNLAVQWFRNAVAVPAGTNASLSISPQTLAAGSNAVSAVVHDPTALVRNDPTNLLTQTVSWTLNVSQLKLDSSVWLSGNKFACRIAGNAPHGFAVQASTNLVDWLALSTNSLSSGQYWFTNSATSGFPKRYFRALLL